ncbi:MAG: zinc-binding dehydrogenase [Armatimonadetes bacterium]|nr:zinc-binding dehydrogenase [Armatimonadota bacterium]
MPRELIVVAPRRLEFREYEDASPPPGHVRVRSRFTAAKHGTELAMYRGTAPFMTKEWDQEEQLFLPADRPLSTHFPFVPGNMTVGIVEETGPGATRFKPGDAVLLWAGFRETHTVPEDRLYSVPDGMTPEQIVCWDPAEFALGAVRDANIRLGETVAIFGLGAIGLIAVQMAKLSGALWVAAIDPIPLRRELAERFGADACYDPRREDVALAIRRDLGRKGVDVTIEASGSYAALHEAIRACHFGGRCVPLAFYQGECKGLNLGEEWHMNRIDMISSRACSDPNRDHPMWDDNRIREVAFELLRSGRIDVSGIVSPIVRFDELLEAYPLIDTHPENVVKLAAVYE